MIAATNIQDGVSAFVHFKNFQIVVTRIACLLNSAAASVSAEEESVVIAAIAIAIAVAFDDIQEQCLGQTRFTIAFWGDGVGLVQRIAQVLQHHCFSGPTSSSSIGIATVVVSTALISVAAVLTAARHDRQGKGKQKGTPKQEKARCDGYKPGIFSFLGLS